MIRFFQTAVREIIPLLGGVERLEDLSLMLFSSAESGFFFIGIALELLSSFLARPKAEFVGFIWTTFNSDLRSIKWEIHEVKKAVAFKLQAFIWVWIE